MRLSVLLSSLALVLPIAGAMVASSGCSGHLVSIGTSAADLASVEPSAVGGGTSGGSAIVACPSGSQHPNVCCLANLGGPVACGTFPLGAGFEQCPAGDETFPDPRFCCDVDNPSSCTAAPTTGSAPAATCHTQCPPGYNSEESSCCLVAADGTQQCYALDAVASETVANTGCIEPPGDGETFPPDSGGVPYCASNGLPDDPACNTDCPAGWGRNLMLNSMCCRPFDGEPECFSMSQGPLQPLASTAEPDGGVDDAGDAGDAGLETPDASMVGITSCTSTEAALDGGPGQCACAENVGGTVYTLECDNVTGICECEVGGQVTGTLPPGTETCQGGLLDFAPCGFPATP